MIIMAVVASNEELILLNENSFREAANLGFLPVVIHPLNLDIVIPSYYDSIALEDFGLYGEINVAKACGILESDEFILHVDPDEFYSHELLLEVKDLEFKLRKEEVGSIKARYYFKHKMLHGTPWGGERDVIKIAHKNVFAKRTHVHQRIEARTIAVNSSHFYRHYWAESFREIEAKHKRYLNYEGALKASQYRKWILTQSIYRLIRVHFGIVRRIRIKDGFTGIVLALIFSKYAILSELKFRSFSKINAND
jgi:hypothetical protein